MEHEELVTLLSATPASARLRVLIAATKTQKAVLAAAIGVTPGHVSNMASGRVEASLSTARQIAEFFGLPIELIFPAPDAQRASA